jgi:hypothetical protein
MAQTTAQTIIDDTIMALRVEAGQAGDTAQVAICDRALSGSQRARAECARVIRMVDDQRNQHEDDKLYTCPDCDEEMLY